MQSSPRTLSTLFALTVVAQSFTYLLSKLVARSGLSARIASCLKPSQHPPCNPKSTTILPQTVWGSLPPGDAEVMISNPTGVVGFIDGQGVLRTARGHYDPLGGRFVAEANASPDPLAKVIDLRKRLGGEL